MKSTANNEEPKGYILKEIMAVLGAFDKELAYSFTAYDDAARKLLIIFGERMKIEFQNGVKCGKQLKEIELNEKAKIFIDETSI